MTPTPPTQEPDQPSGSIPEADAPMDWLAVGVVVVSLAALVSGVLIALFKL